MNHIVEIFKLKKLKHPLLPEDTDRFYDMVELVVRKAETKPPIWETGLGFLLFNCYICYMGEKWFRLGFVDAILHAVVDRLATLKADPVLTAESVDFALAAWKLSRFQSNSGPVGVMADG